MMATLTVYFDDSFAEVIDEDGNTLCPEFSEELAVRLMATLAEVAKLSPVVFSTDVSSLSDEATGT
jgi:hypothetical protein